MAPPSLQFKKTRRVPPLPCGEVVAIVCGEPGIQLKPWGAVKGVPFTLICSPAGLVWTVMGIVPPDPHVSILNAAMRVLQLNLPFVFRYSVVYQNVQSSTGSMAMLL